MSNPYEAPATPSAPRASSGGLSIRRAFADGATAVRATWAPYAGILLVVMLASALSALLFVVPFLVVGPVLATAGASVSLTALEGEVTIAAFQAAARTYAGRLGQVVLLGFVVGVIYLVGEIPGVVMALVVAAQILDADLATALDAATDVVSLVWFCTVTFRVMFAFFSFADDPDLGAVGALGDAWRLTGRVPVRIAGLGLLCMVLQVLGLFACVVGFLPALMLSQLAQASAFRQLQAG